MDQNLYLAATTGDIDGIMKLREKKDQVTSEGHTILHLAALSNKSKCVDAILEKFPRLLDKVNSRKETALHLSASKGYSDVVNLLIHKSKELDSGMIDFLMETRDLDHHVVRELDSDVADLFIRKYRGLEFEDDWVSVIDLIRKRNVESDTALHLAVRNNHPKVVEVIVKADPSDRHAQNTKFETPLYMAIVGRYRYMVEIMLKSCRDPGDSGPQGRTILHAAIEMGESDFVTLILEKKRYLYDIADDEGQTAFHYAALYNCGSILNFLLGEDGYLYGMSVNAVLRCRDNKSKKSALHIAASHGHVSIVIDLMRFYIAASHGHVAEGDNLVYTTKEVEEEGPNILQMTANQNHEGDNLAGNIAEVDEEGQNILHMAADQKHKELVLSILKYCPDISLLLNEKDKNENTPLHLLVKSGCFVPELIKHKDVEQKAKNKENFTPYDLLYLHDDILDDQLMIKKAFDDTEANQHWYNLFSTFWSSQNNTEISHKEKNLRFPSKRRIKDAKFEVANAQIMKDEVKLYRGRTNTQIVVTALITTVTFTVGFTMPGGYHQSGEVDEGSALLSKKKAFSVFMIADTIALVLSTASLFLYFISSMYQDPHEISKFNAASTGLNIVSVVAMMLTFITGTYVVLPSSPALAITVCVISCLFFLQVIFIMIKLRYDRIEKFKV